MGELSKGFLQILFKNTIIVALLLFTYSAEAKQCSNLFDRTVASVSAEIAVQNPDQLKVGTYNLLNLYLHTGNIRKDNKGPHEKPRWAIEQMARLLKEENYDIFVAQEVESVRSAKKFNEEYLGNQYNIYSTTTKDIRGLFVVFFVKKNLPFSFKLESHAEEMWFDTLKNQKAHVFERDLPTLHVYKNANDEVPMLTMLGVHFKSKRDRFGPKDSVTGQSEVEIESNVLREAQANKATQIIQRYQITFGYDHPIMIAGDFNSNHNYAPEFSGFLRHAKLLDSVGMKRKIEKYSDRTTHSYFGSTKPNHSQLDGILITPSLGEYLIDSYVVKYRNAEGSQKDIPRTKQDRKQNPSDHRPITAIFSLEKFNQR